MTIVVKSDNVSVELHCQYGAGSPVNRGYSEDNIVRIIVSK